MLRLKKNTEMWFKLGQSIDIRHLGKYLRKSYDKYYKKYKEEFAGQDEETIKKMARIRQHEDLVDGVQTIQYQLNTLMTTNGRIWLSI